MNARIAWCSSGTLRCSATSNSRAMLWNFSPVSGSIPVRWNRANSSTSWLMSSAIRSSMRAAWTA